MTSPARRLGWFGTLYLVSLVAFLLATGLVHAILWFVA